MNRRSFWLAILIITTVSFHAGAQRSSFQVVPLGVRGGVDESNLSCYAIAVAGTQRYVCLDAGTVHTGIRRAMDNGVWQGDPITFQRRNIKGFLISHPHLDHVSGMILTAPEDSAKNVYGTASCLSVLADKYFSWKNWANFTNEGEKPRLDKYHFVHLTPGTEAPLTGTDMSATAFLLSHGNPFESTAFLMRYQDTYLLYLGDTGADEVEHTGNLQALWTAISPLIRTSALKAIFIEVSYPNEQPVRQLFGHLTPALLTKELEVLAGLCGADHLRNVPIVVTHMKPGADREMVIRQQLGTLNTRKFHFIFPDQGKPLEF